MAKVADPPEGEALIRLLRAMASGSIYKEQRHDIVLNIAADALAGWERAFDLYWKANQRATELWREAHPDQKAILPDQGKMIDWLVDEVERLRSALQACAYAMKDDNPADGWKEIIETAEALIPK